MADELLPARHRDRVDRPHVPAGHAGQRRAVRLPALRAVRLPRARGPVRELVAADRDHPDRADVPLAAIGGIWLVNFFHGLWLAVSPPASRDFLDNNIFTQIGFVVLIGLAGKNAMLIVEFARELEEQGKGIVRGRDRGLPAAPAADPDDELRVHRRRGAAGLRDRARVPRCATPWASRCSPACSA